MNPEQKARLQIDRQLEVSGWRVSKDKDAWRNGDAVAIEEWIFPNGIRADYLLFVDGKAIAVVEAKPSKTLMGGIHHQADQYAASLDGLTPAWRRPLPFIYVANGTVVLYADRRDKYSRQRLVFSFHRPETLMRWAKEGDSTLQNRLMSLPDIPLPAELNLRQCQIEAIENLEDSFKEQKRRAYLHVATGAGKTYTACTFCHRLVKYARARRILFLVDRGNLGVQAHGEFANWPVPETDRKFSEEYEVLRLTRNRIEGNPRVVISTIQRVYSILTHADDNSADDDTLSENDTPKEAVYNAELPPEYFDFIVVDECHRSIYKNWRKVLEYFDATIIGLTATETALTTSFFDNNRVANYSYAQSVKDGVNVGYCIYRIRTQKTEYGGELIAGGEFPAFRKDLLTQVLDDTDLVENIPYEGKDLNRFVESEPQVRTVIQAYKDAIYRDLYPERMTPDEEYNINYIPKTLIFAQTDAHAELITRVVQEVFGRGDSFCKKVTYSVSGIDSQTLVKQFRTDPNFRVAVTVDMIATGTDVRPLEVVLFMRDVKSATYYQQMYGRGCRTISDQDLRNVTPNARSKDFFYLVDAVGVTEHTMVTSLPPLTTPATESLEILMEKAYKCELDEDKWQTLAYRLNLLVNKSRKMGHFKEMASIRFDESYGCSDDVMAVAEDCGFGLPALVQRLQAHKSSAYAYCFAPSYRNQIIELYRKNSIWVDTSPDGPIEVGFSKATAEKLTQDFRNWIGANKDRIHALQLLFTVGEKQEPLLLADLEELVAEMKKADAQYTVDTLWRNYSILVPERCQRLDAKGTVIADVIQLVKYAMQAESDLKRFNGIARQRFELWLGRKKKAGIEFTEEQRRLLNKIAELIAEHLTYELADIREHDGALVAQCKKAGLSGYEKELYNALVA